MALTKDGKWYIICSLPFCGYSLMAKLQLPKLAMRVRFPLPAPKPKGQASCLSLGFLCVWRSRKPADNRQVTFPPSYHKREVDELANGEFGVQIPVTRSKTEGTSLVLVPSVFVRVAVAKTRRQPTSYPSPSYRKREVDELANGEFGVQIPVTRSQTQGTSLVLVPSVFVRVAVARIRRQPTNYPSPFLS